MYFSISTDNRRGLYFGTMQSTKVINRAHVHAMNR